MKDLTKYNFERGDFDLAIKSLTQEWFGTRILLPSIYWNMISHVISILPLNNSGHWIPVLFAAPRPLLNIFESGNRLLSPLEGALKEVLI